MVDAVAEQGQSGHGQALPTANDTRGQRRLQAGEPQCETRKQCAQLADLFKLHDIRVRHLSERLDLAQLHALFPRVELLFHSLDCDDFARRAVDGLVHGAISSISQRLDRLVTIHGLSSTRWLRKHSNNGKGFFRQRSASGRLMGTAPSQKPGESTADAGQELFTLLCVRIGSK